MPLSNPPSAPRTGSVTAASVASSTTAASLLAANPVRSGFSIWNASTATLFIDYGATVTTTAYAVRIDPAGYFESPFGFTGQISGVWSAANGSALVREFS